MATEPIVLSLDEPAHGIDVGSKAEVHRILAKLADSGLAILVTSHQIELAVLNLVINSRDAMPDGGIIDVAGEFCRVSGEPNLADGDYIAIDVTDTGKGMDPATLRRAVEPFFSTKGVGKGTGLGLSMIHGLALQLNGALQLNSRAGKGTRARLLLPAALDGPVDAANSRVLVVPTALAG